MTVQPDGKSAAAKREFSSCFSTMGCPALDLPAVVALAKSHGVECLELRSLADTVDLPAYFAALPGGVQGVRDLLASESLPVRVLGTSFKLVGDNEKGRGALLDFARLAAQLDVPYLRIFGGGTWGTALTEADFSAAAGVLEWWNKERTSNGWQTDILIETHDAFSAPAPLLELFERSGRTAGVIWDSHHTWRLAGETPAQSWNSLRPFVKHVHIKDSIGVPSARHPYTYVMPGAGEMPLGEVMSVLRRDGYHGAVSLEWEKMWHPYLEDLSAALAASREMGVW